MLFYIDKSIIQGQLDISIKSKLIRAVNNILFSVWESNHLVDMDRPVVDFFLDTSNFNDVPNSLSNDSIQVLLYIRRKYSELDYSKITKKVIVVLDENIISTDSNGDIRMSIDFMQRSKLFQETTVLCEDQDDCVFFEFILDYYLKYIIRQNIQYAIEPDHGGGGQIYKPYSLAVEQKNHFCLAFCDSDKKYPNSNFGTTATRLNNLIDKTPLCSIYTLKAHEIENLLPFNFIEKIVKSPNSDLTFCKKIVESNQSALWQFYDIKKGYNLFEIDKEEELKLFVMDCFLCSNSSNFDAHIDKLKLDNNPVDYKGILVGKKLGKLMDKFKEKLEDLKLINPIFLEFQSAEWNLIGQELLNWTCARNKETLN